MSSESALGGTTLHGTASISRDLAAPPRLVFAAFAEPSLRDRWFRMPGQLARDLDFRVGGSETATAVTDVAGSTEHLEWRSRILDIAPERRIVFVYELIADHVRRYVSLTTVELAPAATGTRIGYTEQFTVLAFSDRDGTQDARHLQGSLAFLLNRLEAALTQRIAEASAERRTDSLNSHTSIYCGDGGGPQGRRHRLPSLIGRGRRSGTGSAGPATAR